MCGVKVHHTDNSIQATRQRLQIYTVNGTEWPYMRLSAVKKLLNHSLQTYS